MVADALDVLGAEQKMRAGRDIARVFHHVGQKLAEERGVHGIDFLIALADGIGLLGGAGRIDVEDFLELHQRQFRQVFETTGKLARHAGAGNRNHALGRVLAKIAHTLEIGCNTQRADDFTKVCRHRLALGDGDDCLVADLTLGVIEDGVVRNDFLRQRGIRVHERPHGVGTHLFGKATHFRNTACEEFQLLIIGRHDMRMGRCLVHGLVLRLGLQAVPGAGHGSGTSLVRFL
ncbi:hypothetical protein AT6N2_C2082 [Agrobacterium tumefaciens]|nr:hypothetical protein AT6N2_C2082 [Agrobacterium tumefaciens]